MKKPKAKFRVGQVVRYWYPATSTGGFLLHIVRYEWIDDDGEDGGSWWYESEIQPAVAERFLRPLTAREIGPRPKTFEEVAELHDIAAGLYATNTLRGRQLSSCADKIHACLAAKDRRIASLEADATETALEKKALQAQIDRVRVLAEELNQYAGGDWGVREQIAKRILTALGEPAAELERKQR